MTRVVRVTEWAMVALVMGFFGRSALATAAGGQDTPDAAEMAVLAKIQDEGLHRSKVEPVFDMFVNVIGPRLTGSPAQKQAADFARDTLTSWGLTDAHLEPWDFGRGWSLEKLTVEMVEPRYMPLVGYAEAWTPSTNGEQVVDAVSIAGKTPEEVEAMNLSGVAVLQQPLVTNFIVEDRPQPADLPNSASYRTGAPTTGAAGARAGAAPGRAAGIATPQQRITAALAKAAVILKPSRGDYGTVFVQAGRNNPPATTPAIVLMGEQYNMIVRLLDHHIPVKLRVNIQSRFYTDDPNSYNVIAEIPGTDPALKDQVVMLGGHLDCWHAATGATDNADGASAVMEALRILKAVNARPRRTVRIGVWSGEEEGLLGSKAYVAAHLAGDGHRTERDRFDVYLNIDPGYGPIYGWYMENNDAAKPIFDAWLAALPGLGLKKNVRPGIPSTDHLSFTAIGLPGFNVIQSYKDYDTRLHHTNVDTADRVSEADLEQNATVLASFAYLAAMRPEMIPGRK